MKNALYKSIAALSCAALLAATVFATGCSSVRETIEEAIDRASLGEAGTPTYELAPASEVFSGTEVRDPQVQLKGNGEDTVTVLVYMNGSNLESDSGEATTDLTEMVKAGSSDRVNVVVQTMGTKKWQKYGISNRRSQRYMVNGSGLELVDDSLGQLDCTKQKTLKDFISWGTSTYPADRYMLLFWNHGGGPVYGFGYDEYQDSDETLTLDEMRSAIHASGTYFDMIGMDCCIMSSLEVACAFYDYCDYTVLSEDFESGLGWSYSGWLSSLYSNSSISTPELAAKAIDDSINANETSKNGDDGIMALINEGMLRVLYTAWTDFAYANEDELLDSNYSRTVSRDNNGRVHPLIARASADRAIKAAKSNSSLASRGLLSDLLYYGIDYAGSDYEGSYGMSGGYSDGDAFAGWGDFSSTSSLSDYFITDIMSVAQNIDSDESSALSSALSEAILYTNSTEGDSNLTGLSVTLPYGDSDFYSELKTVFGNCGFDNTYLSWLKKFTKVSKKTDSYDYSSWDNSWDGWGDYVDSYDWQSWDYYNNSNQWSTGGWSSGW